ncbi:hypothetical protein G7046_g4886 [Stylonectria norvegica]|nr:hypothetical protein G7046_g4886 [Stylonectria norvegica]
MAERARGVSGKARSTKQLACLSCRRKKVKCQPDPAGSSVCVLCLKLSKECYVPDFDERRRVHTRSLVENLRAENARLQAELEYHRSFCLVGDTLSLSASDTESPEPSVCSPETLPDSPKPDNMIVRLCGGKRQLNSDRAGRLRFFGPTSSLHLMESVTSSVLIRESGGVTHPSWQDEFPVAVQDYLFDLYWTYQHQVLPCIHKEAFLRDMRNGDSKYCSTLLVYCILTRAAAISDQPGLRALALADDAEDDAPYLVRKCVQLLDADLDTPGITTCQSLQLLSEMHCAISHDTKGWMYAGGAGRLAYELGLHRNSEDFETNLSIGDLDQQVRRVVFWSCFNLDREWALYLGRPQFLKLEDIDAKRPGEDCENASLDVRMSAAWTSLLEIVGMICDTLNGVNTPRHRMETLDGNLRTWRQGLHVDFQHRPCQTPPVILLHMQYLAAMILLHRPLANFGKDPKLWSSASEISRQVCVENACLIAQSLQEYVDQHGSVLTMSWISLHIVATAATSLIANIAERRDNTNVEYQLESLRTCLGALNELEKSHVVTRRVKKVIQHAIRLLNLDATINAGGTGWKTANIQMTVNQAASDCDVSQFPLLDLLPTSGQFDMLNSFESYFT